MAILMHGRTNGHGRFSLFSGGSAGAPTTPTNPTPVEPSPTNPGNPPASGNQSSDHNPDGGFQKRIGTRQHRSTDLVSAIYPVGTSLLAGEFDAPWAGFGGAAMEVTSETTIADLRANFIVSTALFYLSLVVSQSNETLADPGVMRLEAGDEGSYDVVYRLPGETTTRHADQLFYADVTDRLSAYTFDGAFEQFPTDPSTPPDRSYGFTGTRKINADDAMSLYLPGYTEAALVRVYNGPEIGDYVESIIDGVYGMTVGHFIDASNAAMGGSGTFSITVDGYFNAVFGGFGGAVMLTRDYPYYINRLSEMFDLVG